MRLPSQNNISRPDDRGPADDRHYTDVIRPLRATLQAVRALLDDHTAFGSRACNCYLCERARGWFWALESIYVNFDSTLPVGLEYLRHEDPPRRRDRRTVPKCTR